MLLVLLHRVADQSGRTGTDGVSRSGALRTRESAEVEGEGAANSARSSATLSRISSAVFVQTKGLGCSFQSASPTANVALESLDGAVDATLEFLLREFGEPPFHQVQFWGGSPDEGTRRSGTALSAQ
jgi:hypothetical protein